MLPQGRVLTAEFPTFWLVNCYVPNSGAGLKRLEYRVNNWDKGGCGTGEQVRVHWAVCGVVQRCCGGLRHAARSKPAPAMHATLMLLCVSPALPPADFSAYLKRLEGSKPVVLTGDLNVAPAEIDIHSPKTNLKSAGG
jgi:exonuclease III